VYAAWTKGNLEPGGELYAPDVTFAPIADGRDSFDRQGFRRFMREFLEQWDDFRVEAVDFLDLGDKVLVTERQRATGKRSGIEMEQTDYAVWTFRDVGHRCLLGDRSGSREGSRRAVGVVQNYRFGREAAIRFAWKAAGLTLHSCFSR
jgi:ketosteroid isomerase-like protein